MTGQQSTPPVADAPGLATAHFYNDCHTDEDHHRAPGLYIDSKGFNALLVGADNRSLTVIDLVGVVEVAGVDVTDFEQLRRLGQHLQWLAEHRLARLAEAGALT